MDLRMPGLAVGPMGAWLSAVGVLRAIHRVDPHAALWWEADTPVVRTCRDVPERDITERMVFCPVVTPWQSGGGWGAKDKESARRLQVLRQSRDLHAAGIVPRLSMLREAIVTADQVMSKAAGRDKDWIVRELRNWLPDEAIPWLDVAVPRHDVPTRGGEHGQGATLAHAPLTGTGGNDGRWDISTNYHAAILAIAPDRQSAPDRWTADPPVTARRGWLYDVLNGTQNQPLIEMSGGPYWPGGDGKPRLLNPWAMIFTVEGLLAFGDHSPHEYRASGQPWTTSFVDTGIAREDGWGEAWLPMWGQPMTLPEVRVALGGPWPRWRGTRAVRPAQMLAAFHADGWPRGLTGFARYALARRRGLSHLAVPLPKIVPPTPSPQWLSLDAAAGRAGVAAKTWSGYVARRQAPGHDDRDPATGRPRWWVGTVDAWMASRPARGTRTDLS